MRCILVLTLSNTMNFPALFGFIALEVFCVVGIVFSIIKIIRIERSKVIWGEIIAFTNLGEPERQPNEDREGPDYIIEVRYEYRGTTHVTRSVVKKDIHYEKGARIKIFLPDGKVESAIVDYNTKLSAYLGLIVCIFLALFLLWQAFFGVSIYF